MDLEAFEKLVDTIGGVYYDVPMDMYWDAPDQNLPYCHPKGYQHLNGEQALKVVRFRQEMTVPAIPTVILGASIPSRTF